MACRETLAPRPFTDAARPARLFWAVEIDDAAAACAQAECDRLSPLVPSPGVRWQPRSNWHLTLFFLGDTTVGQGLATADRLRVPVAALDAFEVGIGRGGAAWFPSQRHPLVIALSAESPPPLLALASLVTQAAVECGFMHEPRPFRGHVSVARVKRGYRPRDPLPENGRARANLRVDHIALYESVKSDAGRIYQPVLKLPLRAASQ